MLVIPLRFDERGLSFVDLSEVLMAPQAVAHLAADAAQQADRVQNRSTIGNANTSLPINTHEPYQSFQMIMQPRIR